MSLYLVLLYDELMPEDDLLAGVQFGDLVVDEFLDYLNAKIAKRRAQKADWHAVLFVDDEPSSEVEEFARRIKYEVIPLFQEHRYED